MFSYVAKLRCKVQFSINLTVLTYKSAPSYELPSSGFIVLFNSSNWMLSKGAVYRGRAILVSLGLCKLFSIKKLLTARPISSASL